MCIYMALTLRLDSGQKLKRFSESLTSLRWYQKEKRIKCFETGGKNFHIRWWQKI